MKKGVVIAVVAVVMVGGIFWYFTASKKPAYQPVDNLPSIPVSTTTPASETSTPPSASYTTYREDTYGFEFQYSSGLTLKNAIAQEPISKSAGFCIDSEVDCRTVALLYIQKTSLRDIGDFQPVYSQYSVNDKPKTVISRKIIPLDATSALSVQTSAATIETSTTTEEIFWTHFIVDGYLVTLEEFYNQKDPALAARGNWFTQKFLSSFRLIK